ncbi:hypothetical protein FQA39_LY10913 [Lamprigera yunnana]|nr:hypothetical protein FQA39_LY10913 [Lamprigera yunnana]
MAAYSPILTETGVGVTTNVQTIDSNQADWFNIAKDVTFIRMNNILYHFDCIFKLTSHYKKLTEAVDNIQAMIADVVRKQIQLFRNDLPEESRPCTFLQKLIEVSKSDVNFTQTDLEEEIVTFLIGGNDTMATTLSYVLMMLGMHPQIQEEVYEEIKSSIGLSQKILEDDLIHFEYLDRVIRETLRLFPPAPCVSRQVTEDIQLENCIVPAGCEIVIAVIAVHRDPKVWPNPLNFDPNRFLPDVSKHPYSWIPFLNGPRNCVASKFAMMTMKVAIAVLVSKYTFKTEYKSVQDVKFEANLLLKPIDGYKVTLELRNNRKKVYILRGQFLLCSTNEMSSYAQIRHVAQAAPKCWNCGFQIIHTDLFCNQCNLLQQPPQTSNYFIILNINQSYDIDLKQMTKKFRELQALLHPDKFSNKSDKEKSISADYSALVNKSYNTLQSPLKRAIHLLNLYGVELAEDQKLSEPEFLMEIMELNEEVEAANTPEQFKHLEQKNKKELEKIGSNISHFFKENNLMRAKQEVIRMRYYNSLRMRINALLRDKGIVD